MQQVICYVTKKSLIEICSVILYITKKYHWGKKKEAVN